MTTPRNEGGSAAVEVVLLGGAFLLLAHLLIGAARLPTARAEVYNATAAATRDAALERDEQLAADAAREAVAQALDGRCAAYSVEVDTSAFRGEPASPGRAALPGRVVVDVACRYDLRRVWRVAGIGEATFRVRVVETVDPFRGSA